MNQGGKKGTNVHINCMTESSDFIGRSYKADLGSGTCFARFNWKDFLLCQFQKRSVWVQIYWPINDTVCCVTRRMAQPLTHVSVC